MQPKEIECNYCGAKPGKPCVYSSGDARDKFHAERIRAAKKKAPREDFSQAAARIVREATKD